MFRVESTLTSTVIPFSVSIVVWCQGTPCSLAVFSRATVVSASLVHEWEHAAVSRSRAFSTRAYWKVKSDRVLRVMTVLYVLRQRVTCYDTLGHVPTAYDVWRQRVTCYNNVLRVVTAGCVSRQWVTCYALRQRVTCYNTVWSVTTACFVLRQRATLMTGCYVLDSCIIHKNTFFPECCRKERFQRILFWTTLNRIPSKYFRFTKNCS